MPNMLGRRLTCEKCGTQVLVTKAGQGAVGCCDKEMAAQQAKALPSSD